MLPDGSGVVLSRSVDIEGAQVNPDFVRACVGVSGFVVRPYEGSTQAHVTYVLQLDPGHVLPPFIVSSIVETQAMNVARLRLVFDLMQKSGAQDSGAGHGEGRVARVSEDDMEV